MGQRTFGTKVNDSPAAIQVAGALVLAVLVAYGLHALIFDGPVMRAAAQQELERAVAGEDRAVCEKFGMHPGTADFVACSRELAGVRQRQSDRDNAAAVGVL